MISEVTPFGLRMPDQLRQRVRAAASKNRRSMNSEIVILLERALAAHEETAGAEFGDRTPAALETRA